MTAPGQVEGRQSIGVGHSRGELCTKHTGGPGVKRRVADGGADALRACISVARCPMVELS